MTTSFEKLAKYLDSFSSEDGSYDFACYIKEKIARLEAPTGHEEENNQADELAVPGADKTKDDLEGSMMSPAFEDLDRLNAVEKDKDRVKIAKSLLVGLKNL
jgi:hypothetical protein